MPRIMQIICDCCGLKLQSGWGGRFYVTTSIGDRQICPHPGEIDYVAEILNFSAEDRKDFNSEPKWWWASSHKERYKQIKEAFKRRTGFLSDCICESCGGKTTLDFKVDNRKCHSCGSAKVSAVKKMPGKVCFSCGKGKFVERDTGIMV